MKIGIGITHHNRHDLLDKTLEQVRKHTPNAKIVIVDDASETPHPEATYYFNENVGIARAKNKCLELLEGCDHIFLLDDDTYPIKDGWAERYIEAGAKTGNQHLMFNFTHFKDGTWVGDCQKVYEDDYITAQGFGRGCLLYLTKEVLKTVGGMRTDFGQAMWEHVEYSRRIHNAGLTRFMFADIKDRLEYIYSTDYEIRRSQTSIPDRVRTQNNRRNKELYEKYADSAEYVEFRDKVKSQTVITCYFTTGIDTQRGHHLPKEKTAVLALQQSLKGKLPLVVLNDCGWDGKEDGVTWINVPSWGNPYFYRWKAVYDYLKDHAVDHAWLVDATDVELLEVPQMRAHQLYSGDEEDTVSRNKWLISHTRNQQMKRTFLYSRTTLLNCGIVGGDRKQLLDLTRFMWDYYCDKANIFTVDMPVYVWYMLDKEVIHGRPVNTRFKHDEREGAWWKHK